MSRVQSLIRFDVLQQQRAHLYTIGVVVAVLMAVPMRALVAEAFVPTFLVLLYIGAIGGTTFFFAAAMVLLERSSGTLLALRTSMVTADEYLISKIVTLTGFALVECVIVYVIAGWGLASSPWWLVLGILVLGVMYACLGLGLAASHSSLQAFIFPTGFFSALVLQLPAFSVLQLGPDALWYLIPSRAPLLLMEAAFYPLETWQWAYTGGMSLAGLVGFAIFCRRRFATHVHLAEA